MAAVAKHQDVSMSTPVISYDHSLSGHIAGEDFEAGDGVYIASTGLLMLAGGTATATDPEAAADYFVLSDTYAGQACTVAETVRMHYGDGLTPGTIYYLSASVPGGLDTTAPFVGAAPVGKAIDTQRILLKSNWQAQGITSA